jgi:hypothetical protein
VFQPLLVLRKLLPSKATIIEPWSQLSCVG